MKKLMIAASAALCATVGFSDVTSANIVGYTGTNLRPNNTYAGSAFVPVSGSTVDLIDIKVLGYDPFEGFDENDEPIGGAFGEVNIQTLTQFGATDKSYIWNDFILPPEEDGDDPIVYRGWYDDGDEPLARGDVELAPGEGFVIKAQDNGVAYSIQSAGQVLTAGDQSVALRPNNSYTANPTPVTVDLKNCYVMGYDPFEGFDENDEPIGGAFGEVNAQTLTQFGATDKSYIWNDFILPPEEDGDDPIVYRGWYDDGDEEIVPGDCTVGAGEGFVIKCQDNGISYTFNWPKVDIK